MTPVNRHARPIPSQGPRTLDPVLTEETFTVHLSTNDDIREARAKLAERVRAFAETLIGRRLRSLSFPPKFGRRDFAVWLTRHVARQAFYEPSETCEFDDILPVVQREHGEKIEQFIDDNLILIGDIKLGS